LHDEHSHFDEYTLVYKYGENEEVQLPIVENKYADATTVSPVITNPPQWADVTNNEVEKQTMWEQCAYQFRLKAW